jgi:hypothetical protein
MILGMSLNKQIKVVLWSVLIVSLHGNAQTLDLKNCRRPNRFTKFSLDAPFSILCNSEQIYAVSKYCFDTIKMAKDLNDFKKSKDGVACFGSEDEMRPARVTNNEDYCAIEITQCIPEKAKQYLVLKSTEKQPNCFNFALLLNGILPSARYSSGSEVLFYLYSPLCQKLDSESSPEAGDIGFIHSTDHKPVHAFYVVSDNFVFSKNGASADSHYTYESIEVMKSAQGVQRMNGECDKPESGRCENEISYFRCDSLSEYFEKNPPSNPDFQRKIKQLNKIDRCFEMASFGQPLSKESLATIKASLSGIAKYLDQVVVDKPIRINPNDRFELQMLISRASEAIRSLNYFDIDFNFKNEPLLKSIVIDK